MLRDRSEITVDALDVTGTVSLAAEDPTCAELDVQAVYYPDDDELRADARAAVMLNADELEQLAGAAGRHALGLRETGLPATGPPPPAECERRARLMLDVVGKPHGESGITDALAYLLHLAASQDGESDIEMLGEHVADLVAAERGRADEAAQGIRCVRCLERGGPLIPLRGVRTAVSDQVFEHGRCRAEGLAVQIDVIPRALSGPA
jgi:hypothetical protein